MSLKYRIALTFFVLEGVLMIFVLWQTLEPSLRRMAEQVEKSDRVLMDTLGSIAKSAIITEEYEDLQLQLQRAMHDTHLLKIYVVNTQNIIVASHLFQNLGLQFLHPTTGDDTYWRNQEIAGPGGNYGRIIIQFSSAPITEANAEARNRGLTVTLFGILLTAIIGLLLGFALSRRLEKLADFADRAAAGDYAAIIDSGNHDEIARVAISFNVMQKKIMETFDGLKSEFLQRNQIEAALRESEERIRSAFNSSPVGQILITDTGIVKDINPVAVDIFGYSPEEILDQNVSMLMPSPDRDKHDGYLRRHLETGISTIIGVGREVVGLRKNSETFSLSLSVGKIEIGEHVSFIGSIIDLTEQKRLEEHIRQSQRLESLGQLTGGVAHEFNNLLTVIGGYSRMANRDLENSDRVGQCLEEIIKASEQAATLTSQMLAFGRKQELKPKVVSVATILRELRSMLDPLIADNIDLKIDDIDDTLYAMVDPNQFSQALLNMAINGGQAMPNGGDLFIGCHIVETDGKMSAQYPEMEKGRYVATYVRDTGTGIDAATQRHIFEPFFTTKETGEGTGLGLSMVHGMIKQAGGTIDVKSQIGEGTTFTIYLPVVDDHESNDEASPQSVTDATGVGTILIVDDKESVRALAGMTLEDLGYTVLMAKDGAHAAEVFEAQPGRIDLLLTDLDMPGMNGHDLARKLLALRPDLKIIFMSGHGPGGDGNQELMGEDNLFVQKPFDPDDLGALVGLTIEKG
jgi:PAS domain S-box-containing protein